MLGVEFKSGYQGVQDYALPDFDGKRISHRTGEPVPYRPSWLKDNERYWNYPTEAVWKSAMTPMNSLTGLPNNLPNDRIVALFHEYQATRHNIWAKILPVGIRIGKFLPDTELKPLKLAVPYIWEKTGEKVAWPDDMGRNPCDVIRWVEA